MTTDNRGQSAGWVIGDITITPVVEVDAGAVIDGILPARASDLRRSTGWLHPDFVDEDGRSRAVVQAFCIAAGASRIVVDPGVGDGKARPEIPAWSRMRSGLLGRLEDAGFAPERVDTVLVTHLHLDHVGAMTHRDEGGTWQPVFTRARHVLVQHELDYWLSAPRGPSPDALAAIEDSVRPVVSAGLVDRVPADVEVAPGVSLIPSHGHTPGHVSVLVESGRAAAIITGDAIHHPVQLVDPSLGSASDFDGEAAHQSRIALLDRCASSGAWLLGSHFAWPTAGRVTRDGAGYRLVLS